MSQPIFGRVIKAANELPGLQCKLGAIVRYDGRLEVLVEHSPVLSPLVTVLHERQVPVPTDAVVVRKSRVQIYET